MKIHVTYDKILHLAISKRLKGQLVALAMFFAIMFLSASVTVLAKETENSAEKNIIINETTFEDDNFRAWLLDPKNAKGIGADGVLTPEEIASTTWLAIQFQQIKSLKGIEYFTNLTFLDVEGNYLESVDISKLTELRSVYLRTNLLTSIDFSHNTKLEFIEIFDNRLTSIDVSMLPNLTFLHVDYNRLKELDLSKNTKLEGDGFVLNNNMPIEKLILPVIYDKNGAYKTWDSFVISEQDEMEGYATVTWYKDENYTEEVIPNTPQPFDGSTYYAKRNPNAYTIYFNGGSGTSGSIPSIHTYWNETIVLPGAENLTKKGYLFDEWILPNSSRKKSGEEVKNIGGKYSYSTRATVSAAWKPITYTISVKDVETNMEKTIQAVYDTTSILPDAPGKREGFLFAGWKLPDGTIAGPGTSVKNLTAHDGATVTIEGQWIEDQLGVLKQELLQNIDEFISQITASSEYYQGVKEEAKKVSLETSSIQDAENVQEAQECYEKLTDTLHNLPNITEVNNLFEKEILQSENIPSAQTDLKTLEDARYAEKIAYAWDDVHIQDTLSVIVEKETESGSVAYTKEDQENIVNWLSRSSSIQQEREYAVLLMEAAQIIKDNSDLMETSLDAVTPEQIADYENLLHEIDGARAASILISYRQSVSERADLARAKMEALLKETKQEAIRTLESRFYAAYEQKEYTTENWNTMYLLLEQAETGILAANSLEEIDVENVWSSLHAELSQIPKISMNKPPVITEDSTSQEVSEKPSRPDSSVSQSAVVKPKSTNISKIKASKKSMTVKWKKRAGITGYQVQYSTNKSFGKGTKTITIKKRNITSKKITKLKAQKKYYVRVCTYKTVKENGEIQNIYSPWSKVRSVKTKK